MLALYFSDDIPPAATGTQANTDLLDKVRDILEVNDAAARVTSVSTSDPGGGCNARKVTVTLDSALRAGDRIAVAASAHTFGTQDDERTLAPVTPATVMRTPTDTAPPRATIIGIEGETGFQIRITDAGKPVAGASIELAKLHFASGNGDDAEIAAAPAATDANGITSVTLSGRSPTTLVARDSLTLLPGAVSDAVGNASTRTGPVRALAERTQASPKIAKVEISEPNHSQQASWTLAEGSADTDYISDGTGAEDNNLTIKAKKSGDAAGAAGNTWTIRFDTASGHNALKPLDIDVRVDPKGQVVTVRFVNGKTTLGDLIKELRSSSAFSERFTATTDCSANLTAPIRVQKASASRNVNAAHDTTNLGTTLFAIEASFGAYVVSVVDDNLLDDVFARTAVRNAADTDNDTTAKIRTTLTSASTTGSHTAYSKTVRYEMTVTNAAIVPKHGDLVIVDAGTTTTNAVATGYLEDADTSDEVYPNLNAAGRVFIRQTSNVKAPTP